MNTSSASIERRDSFRCQVPESKAPAIVRAGKTDIVVRVLEESAGGFGITCDHRPSVKTGQIVSMATGAGYCEAKIVHVTKKEDSYHIGLQRLREVNRLGGGLVYAIRDWRTYLAFGLVIALCFFSFAWGMNQSPDSYADLKNWFYCQSEPCETTEPVEPRANKEEALALNYLNFNNLRAPQFVQKLNLDKSQQSQLNGIMMETTNSVNHLYARRGEIAPADWTDLGMDVMDAAWADVHVVLTDDQVAQLKSLMAESKLSKPVQ